MEHSHLSEAQRRLADANRREYGEHYHQLSFLDAQGATRARQRRHALMEEVLVRAQSGAFGSKLDMNGLSPGCRKCVEGSWSCLFINGRCNCDCFYCPTSQDELGLPTTNSVQFRHPDDYVAYLERFGFTGASLSGGEPLLTPGRSLGYLRAVKKRFADKMHCWLYTNGTLLTAELLGRLRDEGLDEIRLDIGATNYHLKNAELAARYIPVVTVEIPAVPEQCEQLKSLLRPMRDAGVKHLNLHQLRLTPYNFPKLATRPYHFVHGEKVTVLESELCALEVMAHGFREGIELPVNYCSFVYKNRHQKAAARRRGGLFVRKAHESLTDAGLIRSLVLKGAEVALKQQAAQFESAGIDASLWQLDEKKGRLAIHARMLERCGVDGLELWAGYAEAAVRERASGYHGFQELRLPSNRKLAIERWSVRAEGILGGEQRRELMDWVGGSSDAPPKGLAAFEQLPEGMQEYF